MSFKYDFLLSRSSTKLTGSSIIEAYIDINFSPTIDVTDNKMQVTSTVGDIGPSYIRQYRKKHLYNIYFFYKIFFLLI